MICTIDKLRSKEVVDILTGERLGYIDDAEIDTLNSTVKTLIIYGRPRFFGLLGKEEDILIPCDELEVIGSDIILIRHNPSCKSQLATNYPIKRT